MAWTQTVIKCGTLGTPESMDSITVIHVTERNPKRKNISVSLNKLGLKEWEDGVETQSDWGKVVTETISGLIADGAMNAISS